MNSVFTIATLALFAFLLLQSLRRAEWALLLIILFLPLEQLMSSYIPFLARNTVVMNLVVGGTAVMSVLIASIKGERPFRGYMNPTTALVALLYVFTLAGAMWTPLPEAARHFITTGIPYYGLLLFFMPALASAEGIRRIHAPLMLVGMAIALLIMLSPRTVFYGSRMFVDLSYATGSRDSRGNPLVVGELGGMILIAAALMGSGGRRPLMLMLRIAAALLGMWIAVLSAVRGQLVFAILVAVVCYPLANQVKNMGQFFAKTAAAGVMCVFFYIAFKVLLSGSGDSAERWSAAEVSDGLGARMFYATEMMGAYFSRPGNFLQGLGTGSFNSYVAHDSEHYIYPHNLFIEVLGEHGLIGFALLMGIIFTSGMAAKRLILGRGNDPLMKPAFALTIAMCGFMSMIAMKQGSYAIIPIPFHWYLVMTKIDRRKTLDEAEDAWAASGYEYDDTDTDSQAESYGYTDADRDTQSPGLPA